MMAVSRTLSPSMPHNAVSLLLTFRGGVSLHRCRLQLICRHCTARVSCQESVMSSCRSGQHCGCDAMTYTRTLTCHEGRWFLPLFKQWSEDIDVMPATTTSSGVDMEQWSRANSLTAPKKATWSACQRRRKNGFRTAARLFLYRLWCFTTANRFWGFSVGNSVEWLRWSDNLLLMYAQAPSLNAIPS